ncbi:MAG: helix-turn-helix transcriptional regulator [Clostridia bacterium]|nr:helix-turn-helix transcriptional regulator [Clostridia bacterium]
MRLLIGDKLRELREELNLTQNEVGEKTGCTVSMISSYEINRREPDLDTLKRLCNFFDVSADYLLGRTADAKSYNPNNLPVKQRELLKYFNKLPLNYQDDVIRIARLNLLDYENALTNKGK